MKTPSRKDWTLPVKAIAYAYPSSPDAVRLGFAQTGCWTVETGWAGQPLTATAGFSTWDDARSHADDMPEQYSRYSMPDFEATEREARIKRNNPLYVDPDGNPHYA